MNLLKHFLKPLLLLMLLSGQYVVAEPTADGQLLDIVRETSESLPGYNIYRPADLQAVADPLPIIAWGNGACARFDQVWRPIIERFAAHGYLVMSVAQVPLPTSGGNSQAEGVRTMSRMTADDQQTAIDWAIAQNTAAGGPYKGHLDTNRIVAAGNSCGGIISLALAGKDPRVKAIFILSGSSIGPGATREQAAEVMNKVTVPVGYVVGGPEDIARDQADQDYDLLAKGLASMVVKRAEGDHRAVSTTPDIQIRAADIGNIWLKATLFGNKEAIKVLAGDTPCAICDPKVWTIKTKNLH